MNEVLEKYLNKRWLVVRFSHLGDVLLTTGVLARWGELYGKRFSVLTSTELAPIFEGHPYIEQIHSLDIKKMPLGVLVKEFKALAKTYAGADLVDLHCNLRTRVLRLFWKGGYRKYHKMSFERRAFLATKSSFFAWRLRQFSVPQRYDLALESWPSEQSLLRPKMWLTKQEQSWGKDRVVEIFGENIQPVALHPYATHENKTFSRERWQKLIAMLDNAGIPWLIIGRGEALTSLNKADLTNQCSLRQSAAVLASCRCLITGDSGPMHLASAVDTPVIAFFGPTTREWGFFPAGELDTIIELDLPCRPCSLHGKAKCQNAGGCLESIPLEQIIEAVRALPEQAR